MKSDFEAAVNDAMKMFSEEYGSKFAITEDRIKVWEHILDGFSPGSIRAAAYHLVSTMEIFPPDIAKMRKTVVYISAGKLSNPSPLESWEKVCHVINGKTDTVLTQNEKDAMKQIGSLWDLRHSTNQQSDRARYIQALEGILKKEDEELLTMPRVKKYVSLVSEKLCLPGPKRVPEFELVVNNEPEPDPEETKEALEESKKRLRELVASI